MHSSTPHSSTPHLRSSLHCTSTPRFSPAELKDNGYSATELREGTFTARDLKPLGYSAGELRVAGFDATEMRAVGYTLAEMKEGACTATEVGSLSVGFETNAVPAQCCPHTTAGSHAPELSSSVKA